MLVAATAVAWLFAGRQFSLFWDHLMTVPIESLPVSPLAYDGDNLKIGERVMSAGLQLDSGNRVILSSGGKAFPLGYAAKRSDIPGDPEFEFIADPGDRITFTIERSYFSWPTPFEFNFMTGRSPSWKRHRYYRLFWRKNSGAKLEMAWRYEQWFYPSDGWTNADMIHRDSTGLIRVEIR